MRLSVTGPTFATSDIDRLTGHKAAIPYKVTRFLYQGTINEAVREVSPALRRPPHCLTSDDYARQACAQYTLDAAGHQTPDRQGTA